MLDIVEGRAIHHSRCEKTYLRVARVGATIYIDLGAADWSAVEITSVNWRIINNPPVKFRRTKNTGALPLPQKGGSLDLLRPLAATTDENWVLIKGWILDALKGHGPYMVLVVTGEQGSAKSSLCRLMRSVVDPLKTAKLASLPREEKDLGVDGMAEHLLAYDNVSYLPQWLSDCLCRVSTGGGIKSRQLYTDGEQCIFDICRPICLNGIPDFATANDLLGRSLVVSQPTIDEGERLDEQKLELVFADVAPRVFGAILDLLSRGLGCIDAVAVPHLPRMADSAKWIMACGVDGFIEEYQENIDEAVGLGLDASPIANSIVDLVTKPDMGWPPNCWKGEPSQLLSVLSQRVEARPANWPKNARSLSSQLRRDAPALRKRGITIRIDKTNGRRLIEIAEERKP